MKLFFPPKRARANCQHDQPVAAICSQGTRALVLGILSALLMAAVPAVAAAVLVSESYIFGTHWTAWLQGSSVLLVPILAIMAIVSGKNAIKGFDTETLAENLPDHPADLLVCRSRATAGIVAAIIAMFIFVFIVISWVAIVVAWSSEGHDVYGMVSIHGLVSVLLPGAPALAM